VDDDDEEETESIKAAKGPAKIIIKGSGIVFQIHIDPDNTDDESNFNATGAKSSSKIRKNESTIS
jgi:hypothetical protein